MKILLQAGRWLIILLSGAVVLILVASIVSFWVNQRLPSASPVLDRLDSAEKARLAEAFHLRQTLGELAWPGWGETVIPTILYNERYAFLVRYADPPPGWTKVGASNRRGGPWEVVPGDHFEGELYYRQRLPGAGITPEAFTVLVGEQWVASLSTKEWMKIGLAEQVRQDLPPVLKEIFPYGLFVDLLINSSDGYIAALLHESFHAYQGLVAPERLAEAERASQQREQDYPWQNPDLQKAWQVELDLLADAVATESDAEVHLLARRFLQQRAERRTQLPPLLVDYERQREWLEGLAKYMEMEIWRQAASAPEYTPIALVADDPDFKGYTTFEQKWSREVDQMRRMAGSKGGGRFYYSGMAQAVLLDRLAPGWKAQALAEESFLEDLLQEALLRNG